MLVRVVFSPCASCLFIYNQWSHWLTPLSMFQCCTGHLTVQYWSISISCYFALLQVRGKYKLSILLCLFDRYSYQVRFSLRFKQHSSKNYDPFLKYDASLFNYPTVYEVDQSSSTWPKPRMANAGFLPNHWDH